MTCAVEGCEKKVKNRGWCSAHYARWLKKGDPGPAGDLRLRPPRGPCSIDGCDNVADAARGWCSKHYMRWQNHGDPTVTLRPTYGSGRVEHVAGYVRRWAPDHPLADSIGYVLEHRLVAYEHGMLTGPDDRRHVHHLNHDKTDNRIENLEVLTATEHARRHLDENGSVTNQFGTWPLRRLAAS